MDENFLEWPTSKVKAAAIVAQAGMTPIDLARWAADLLEIASRGIHQSARFSAIAAAARRPDRWQDGRELFTGVRTQLLAAEKDEATDPAQIGVLHLAENVCKTIYNLSNAPAPFDADAPLWIPVCVQYIAKSTSSTELRSALLKRRFSADKATEDGERGTEEENK